MMPERPSMTQEFRCGTLAIVGQPNVGKSTLLNQLVGQKISITSKKPQTTRHRVTGILTTDEGQFVFVDTPGFQTRHGGALNRTMNRSVTQALAEVDVILCVLEAGRCGPADRAIFKLLPVERPVLLVINKVDQLADKGKLLPFIDQIKDEFDFAEILPLSAMTGKGTDVLLRTALRYLPEQPAYFEEDEITDRSERFLASELLREKLFRSLGDELPYGMAVEIERFEQEGGLRRIFAAIIVDRPQHKAIVIGKGGEKLKAMSSDARRDMERLFGGKVYLEVWVKVKSGWADDERALKSLGYE
ncbi:membrane-associated, 16S rRNA-binding GTPase [Sterolibacterium denitrificans]|uniref:GTPase Era n=2 Tax=Sterolibacterium denitrificans TaxID=157592 RepID=A0A7Z7HQZ8_9PROT|nr:membrane-associated, 16S rRNA-binding GTPase [Sterolibacterium denitrificans]